MKSTEPACPKHGTMASCVGRADPVIDPGKEWDAIYYCPECLAEEQAEDLDKDHEKKTGNDPS